MDERVRKLAKNLVSYSMRVKAGDKVLIEAVGPNTFELAEALVEEVYGAGGAPFYLLHDDKLRRAQLLGANQEQFEFEAALQKARMEKMDCYVGVRGSNNVLELSDVPSERLKIYSSTVMKKVHMEIRVPKTRWVVLRYPNPTFAQAAKMSTRAFEDFFYKACLLDYSGMSKAMDPLVELMQKTDQVHIAGPGTDLRFSIKGIAAIKCDGRLNIPDGEVFTAPVKASANGVLQTNTPTLYEGSYFEGVRLTFKDGKVVEASCRVGEQKKLDSIFERDEGARYVGEFALGVNPHITRPMLDILFDEKIAGSFHFTPGGCYDEADNGNKSEVHWDLVTRQFAEDGGGEIRFDGKLVRQDGLFVLDSLKALNP
ncbi:MAG: aminopeptidase [Myxococcales bacterium]|nr:MAG: aminopeptidase [Myxococcales bacterium]